MVRTSLMKLAAFTETWIFHCVLQTKGQPMNWICWNVSKPKVQVRPAAPWGDLVCCDPLGPEVWRGFYLLYSYFPVTTAFALASQQSRNRIHGTTILTISDDTWWPDDPPSFFADRRAHHSASPDICWLIASPVQSPAQWSLLQIIKRVAKPLWPS